MFDDQQHLTKGDAAAAAAWIGESTFPENEKAALLRFVGRFPSLTFVKEDDALLDHYQEVDGVTLPPWFRAARSTLAFTDPDAMVRVSGFQWDDSPRSEYADSIWYVIHLGYINEEDRETLFDAARLYLIGMWFENNRSHLAVDLDDPADRRIFEFTLEDLWDDELNGDPVRDSTFPIFQSYAHFLGNVVAVTLSDGTVVEAVD